VIREYLFLRNDAVSSAIIESSFVHERKLAPSAGKPSQRVTDLPPLLSFCGSAPTPIEPSRKLMVYEVKGQTSTLGMGLSREDDWKIAQTKGIARTKPYRLFNRTSGKGAHKIVTRAGRLARLLGAVYHFNLVWIRVARSNLDAIYLRC